MTTKFLLQNNLQYIYLSTVVSDYIGYINRANFYHRRYVMVSMLANCTKRDSDGYLSKGKNDVANINIEFMWKGIIQETGDQ